MQTIIVGKHLPVGPVERLLERSGTTRYICVDDLEAVRWIVGETEQVILIVDAGDINKSQLGVLPANVNYMLTNAEDLVSADFAALFLANCNSGDALADAA